MHQHFCHSTLDVDYSATTTEVQILLARYAACSLYHELIRGGACTISGPVGYVAEYGEDSGGGTPRFTG